MYVFFSTKRRTEQEIRMTYHIHTMSATAAANERTGESIQRRITLTLHKLLHLPFPTLKY